MSPSPINTPAPNYGSAIVVTTTTETVIATSGPVNADNLETSVNIEVTIDITCGTASTGLTVRFRRSTVTGALITNGGTWGPFLVTAARYNFDCLGQDVPGLVGGQLYVCTVQLTAATGNSTVNVAGLQVMSSALS